MRSIPSIFISKQPHLDYQNKPMTKWQLGLLYLCRVMVAWGFLECGGALMTLFLTWVPELDLSDLTQEGSVQLLIISVLIAAVFNLFVGWLGKRAAFNPNKMALFFWITLSDAVLTSWALASSISEGSLELTSLISSAFIIILAVYAWQTRATTGYFDNHPKPEDFES